MKESGPVTQMTIHLLITSRFSSTLVAMTTFQVISNQSSYFSFFFFIGTRQSSRLTGNLHFQGKNILTSTLQDLVSTFGINQADSLVLVGSGTGARGVGYNCDYVRLIDAH